MKPAPFDYHRPSTLEEAVELLQQYEGDAKVLAGGQSLIPLLNMRLARPAALIDIERVAGLRELTLTEDALRIGAMTRHADVERSRDVGERLGILAAAMPHIGHLAIRSRGTIGGSLVHADPAAELPALALLLDGVFTVVGPEGTRDVPASDFFLTFLTSCLDSNEILKEVTFALPPLHAGWSFKEVARRHGDFALAGCATLLELTPEGNAIVNARVSLLGVDATPVRLIDLEAQLPGYDPTDPAIERLAMAAVAGLEPPTDVHGTAQFRRDIAGHLIAIGVREASGRAASIASGAP
jgi:aerobic carbon-monoxide dehydrogenase medium subunit